MNSIENQFVPYELAVKLKELGFDEECLGSWGEKDGNYIVVSDCEWSCMGYDENYTEIDAPLWQQAFDWFRVSHKMPNWVAESTKEYWYKIVDGDYWFGSEVKDKYTYEEARLACLEKLIELVSNRGE